MTPASHIIEYADGLDERKIVVSAFEAAALEKALASSALAGKQKEELAKALATLLRGHTAFLIERYKNGERHDATNGAAAIESFDAQGMPVLWKRFDNGQLQDAPDGEPAMVVLAKGDFTFAESFTRGKSNKKLSPQELAEARWIWAKKHARPAPPDNGKPGPASSPKI